MESLLFCAGLLHVNLKYRILLFSARSSSSASLVQGHLKVSYYLRFSLHLHLRQAGALTGPIATWVLVDAFRRVMAMNENLSLYTFSLDGGAVVFEAIYNIIFLLK